MDYLLPVLYIVGLYGTYLAGSLDLRTRAPQPVRPRVPQLTLLLVVGIPTTLQIFFPGLLPLLQRDRCRSRRYWPSRRIAFSLC